MNTTVNSYPISDLLGHSHKGRIERHVVQVEKSDLSPTDFSPCETYFREGDPSCTYFFLCRGSHARLFDFAATVMLNLCVSMPPAERSPVKSPDINPSG